MIFYRLFFGLALSLYAPYALLREALGGKRIGDWKGRLGRIPLPRARGSIWIHAVSVGEVGAANAILRAIREAGNARPLVLSSSTAAGLDLARASREADHVVPFPFDLRRPVEGALDALDPCLLLLTETEIWPLLLESCSRRGIPVALVNGRISDRSFSRYRAFRALLRKSLRRITLFAMQSELDAKRIRDLGAPPESVLVTGNVKFDVRVAADAAVADRVRGWADGRRVVIAGSTHEGEEAAVLDAWNTLKPQPLLVLAPRRPERFDAVFALLLSRGIRAGRSSAPAANPDVVLLDTVGDLASAYGAADVAFIGGSLVPVGGHNPIEAWAHGIPTILGPHTGNFREIVRAGIAGHAAVTVRDSGELAAAIRRFLDEGDDAAGPARALVDGNRGAARAAAQAVLSLRKTA
ncbi:MAG: 3-deoxy-D-manno-octulosonic acid transferase [Thermoanaerobaculia bacterium]